MALPPFFAGMGMEPAPVTDIAGARVLAWLGDSVTTDHISPAGSIPAWSPAGGWLQERGVAPLDFNSYGARRGHHEVMMRGTFGSIRLRNLLADGKEGPYTRILPSGDEAFLYDAAMTYRAAGRPGPRPGRARVRLGLVARLGGQGDAPPRHPGGHRRELRADPPLEPRGDGRPAPPVPAGRHRRVARVDGPRDATRIAGLGEGLAPRARLAVVATADPADGGGERRFTVECRLDGPIEVDYYRQGGILPAVLRRIARESGAS